MSLKSFKETNIFHLSEDISCIVFNDVQSPLCLVTPFESGKILVVATSLNKKNKILVLEITSKISS